MELQYFSPEADPALFVCPCGECEAVPSDRLLTMLDAARFYAGVPFVVTSGPRCEQYNELVGGRPNSEHIPGDGADISAPNSRTRFHIVRGALLAGFVRIGVGKDMVHLGVSETNDPDVLWTYYG